MSSQDLEKIGMMFINWIQVHRDACNRFEDFRNYFDTENPDAPIHSREELNKAFAIQEEASNLAAESKKRYNTLLEEVDVYLARERVDVLGRGANDLLTDARQKAEDQINNGARLTKHKIDL